VILSEPVGVDAAQYVLTPDRRVKLHHFDASAIKEILVYGGTLGSSVAAAECYRDEDTPHGEFQEAELAAAVRVALSRTRAMRELEAGRQPGRALEDRIILEARAAPAELLVINDREPSLVPPAGPPIGGAAGPAIGEHDGTAKDEETPAGIVTPRDKWCVIVGAAAVKPGNVFEEGTRKMTCLTHFGLFSVGNRVCVAVREGADGTSRSAVSEA
jgi:hypothetical protein